VLGLGRLVEVGLGGEQALDARGRDHHQPGDRQGPDRDAHAIAAEDRPDERGRAGQLAQRTIPYLLRIVTAAVPGAP
jgi:hypothetical protein